MNEELFLFIEDLKKEKRLYTFDETKTKQAVILRILQILGWNPFDVEEVCPEYSVGSRKVDYALRYHDKNKVFIEVKKINEDLEKHQEQLLNYSFQEGVKLAILTNGVSWWFYLPLREGNWEQRKFYTIEIYDQKSEDIVKRFEEFLSKESVISDKAIENAEKIYKSKQKQFMIKETLPDAWKKIITEPDELLVEILAETTEKLCGYKPDNETVKKFLTEINQKPSIKDKEESPALNSKIHYFHQSDINYAGKSIVAFTFLGTKYFVQSWKEMLIKISMLMVSMHGEQFSKVLSLRGRKRPYFSKNPEELRIPEKIKNTDIYIETNLSANGIVKLSKSIINLFGYDEKKDLIIEVR